MDVLRTVFDCSRGRSRNSALLLGRKASSLRFSDCFGISPYEVRDSKVSDQVSKLRRRKASGIRLLQPDYIVVNHPSLRRVPGASVGHFRIAFGFQLLGERPSFGERHLNRFQLLGERYLNQK
jgi:hypothetical protein